MEYFRLNYKGWKTLVGICRKPWNEKKNTFFRAIIQNWIKNIVLKYCFNCLEICWVKLTVKHGSSKMFLGYTDEKIYYMEKQELNLKKFLCFYILVYTKKWKSKSRCQRCLQWWVVVCCCWDIYSQVCWNHSMSIEMKQTFLGCSLLNLVLMRI